MKEVKKFLQDIGFIYVDWKFDNIGKSKDGNYKLFDFDASGIINLDTNEWIVTPPALIAATPVGATTTILLGDCSFRFFRKVVLPVPAFPVRKRF